MKVVTAREMREIDRRAIEELGLPGLLLMENAGLRVAEAIRRCFGPLTGLRCAVFAGKGNNGGDGLVAARHLFNAGARVEVFLASELGKLQGDPLVNLKALQGCGVEVTEIRGRPGWELEACLDRAGVVVDALLGTGARGPMEGPLARIIEMINRTPGRVVAVDLPSGLDADTGRSDGPCVKADLTVTLGLPKRGLLLFPGAALAGRVWVADISIPRRAVEAQEIEVELLCRQEARALLPPRPADAHKGTFGHVLVVAGSPGMTGAAALAAGGALRSGAGLVTLAVPRGLQEIMAIKMTEVMTRPLGETAEGTLGAAAVGEVLELLAGRGVLAIGPGLSRHPETVRAVRELVARSPVPTVVDADGLNALAGVEGPPGRAGVPLVLTPHPGELGRLMGCPASEVQADRVEAARRAARDLGATVVLKGARTVVAEPGGRCRLIPTGNPGMATGGSGDVLTGVIAALLAQGMPPFDAASLGAYVHGLAGDLAARDKGDRGLSAGDLVENLPAVFAALVYHPGPGCQPRSGYPGEPVYHGEPGYYCDSGSDSGGLVFLEREMGGYWHGAGPPSQLGGDQPG